MTSAGVARGVEIWAALLHLGRDGIASLVERTCRHARVFARSLDARGFGILNEVVLNQMLVSFGSPDATRAVIGHLQAEGVCRCGGTVSEPPHAARVWTGKQAGLCPAPR